MHTEHSIHGPEQIDHYRTDETCQLILASDCSDRFLVSDSGRDSGSYEAVNKRKCNVRILIFQCALLA